MRTYGTALLLLLLLLSGCDSSHTNMAPVSGRVLVDGKPVKGLRVAFFPVGSAENQYPGPASYGFTDADGHYSLASAKDKHRGAVIGRCQVRIETTTVLGPDVPPAEASKAPALPAKYNESSTEFFDVPPTGTDAANFDISSK